LSSLNNHFGIKKRKKISKPAGPLGAHVLTLMHARPCWFFSSHRRPCYTHSLSPLISLPFLYCLSRSRAPGTRARSAARAQPPERDACAPCRADPVHSLPRASTAPEPACTTTAPWPAPCATSEARAFPAPEPRHRNRSRGPARPLITRR
jgi:hypothetical protein